MHRISQEDSLVNWKWTLDVDGLLVGDKWNVKEGAVEHIKEGVVLGSWFGACTCTVLLRPELRRRHLLGAGSTKLTTEHLVATTLELTGVGLVVSRLKHFVADILAP